MEEMRKECVLNILGNEWTLKMMTLSEEPKFEKTDGITDKSTRTMAVRCDQEGIEFPLQNYEAYLKEVKRHEIIHAFLYESGLGNELVHPNYGHDEMAIDFFALQFPKMIEVFKQADAL